ncbi:E3 ubiquitin-protein ligase RMA2-like [Triticum dicoccoides]|uniref:E3 ubiquitin-protein ligase RMA2-like n=1 Tax=Triticum dicoccoides TaxID=85692 RepID=UPI00188F7C72|nr:E3 ubiquitin-protein ligase RMA2-like [Triticum dicoccoides]
MKSGPPAHIHTQGGRRTEVDPQLRICCDLVMTELTEEKTWLADKLQHCIGDDIVGVPDGATPACWDCSICLETATEPVVTLCGHLYCWPCIFRWLTTSSKSKSRASSSARCPVCKAAVSEDHLVPLYGRAAATLSPAGGRGGRVCQVPRGLPVPGAGPNVERLQEPDLHDGGNFYYYENIGINGLDCSNAERLLGGIALAVLLPWATRGGGRPPPPSLYRDGEGWRMARQQRRVARRLWQLWVFLAMVAFLCFLLL